MPQDNPLFPPLEILSGSSPISEKRAVPNVTLEMLQSNVLKVTLPILFSLIFSISIPLNSVSLWFLCRHSRPWTPIIIFCINLTMADLMYSIILPFHIIYHTKGNNWPFDDVLCRMVTVLSYGNIHCSILTMTSISIERYFGVVHPLRYKAVRSVRTAVLSCIIIWALVLLPLIPLMETRLAIPIKQLPIVTCFDVLPKEMFSTKELFIAYFGSLLFFFFFIPLLIMGYCYFAIIWTLLHSPSPQPRESKKHTVYLIIVLLLLVIVCYLPHIILAIVHYVFSFRNDSFYVGYKFSFAIASFNCCFDPLVYYFGSKEFRLKVQKKLCRCVALGFSENTPIFSENDIQAMPIQTIPNT